LTLAQWREQRLPVVIVRLFNTVGPHQTGRYGKVLPTFVHQTLRGQPITVYGDGSQSRSFTHVSDAVHALIQLGQHPAAVGEVFNIGSEAEMRIADLAQLVKTMTHSQSEWRYVPYDEAYEEGFEDMPRRVPDIGKIKRLLNFEPTRSIEAIVQDVITSARRELRQQEAQG
jgi:UDP-glucose 4-epimerase